MNPALISDELLKIRDPFKRLYVVAAKEVPRTSISRDRVLRPRALATSMPKHLERDYVLSAMSKVNASNIATSRGSMA